MSHRITNRTLVGILLIAILVAACGGVNGGGNGGDVEAGKALFEKSVLEGQAGCVTCHSREPGVVLVGPSLANIGNEAVEMVPKMAAEEYLRQSIIQPDAFIVDSFPAGTMPKVWGDVLSEQQVNQLIAYLLTLKR